VQALASTQTISAPRRAIGAAAGIIDIRYRSHSM
jgi:hypothetical protein